MNLPKPQTLLNHLHQARQRHQRRHLIVRGLATVAGVILILGGLGLIFLPGPAFIVIPLGLYLLALEFDWAERVLRKAVAYYLRTKQAASAHRGQRSIVIGLAALLAGAVIVAAVVYYG